MPDPNYDDQNPFLLDPIDNTIRAHPEPMKTRTLTAHGNRISRGGILSKRSNCFAYAILGGIS